MHTCHPYIRNIRAANNVDFKNASVWGGFNCVQTPIWVGYDDYLDMLRSVHPADYKGPFTLGPWWQNCTSAAASSTSQTIEWLVYIF